ncbi:MAG: response regulator [Thermodesulfovibrionia bacterium]|nr:response regulator [Thermodesulfovibrionia bacterium]
MAKKRIMVVEDEGITAMRIQRSMEDMGYTVTSIVISGEEAIEKAEEDKPDLVVMDILLSGKMNGIEAAGKINSRFNIPVVYLTAYSDEKMIKTIKKTEPLGYIIKPFDERELRIVVEIAFYKHEMERRLKEAKDELTEKVKERTAELQSTIERLQKTEKKLSIHAEELAESNTALKVLLRQREKDQREFENNILSNIKHLIMPYLEKLKKNRRMSDELVYISIIESNMNDIVSPFSAKLSFQYMNFTPREIMIADLIKDGKQDKDIMEILNISFDTVKAHRKNIRKKLGINNKKINLRTKLLSLSE